MAQTVSTTPRHHFYQNNGELAAGGTLEIFEANTITHAVTWFDRDGTVAHQNANPLTLDSQGAAVVWLEAGKVYDWLARDALGNIIDNAKGITGSTSAIDSSSQWVVTGMIPTFVNTRTFTVIGDQTSIYSVGRRVRVTFSGGFKYATIISSVFSTLTTITLGFANSSDVLDATISAVDVGLDVASSPSMQVGVGSVIDLTGYTGADVPLQIGQSSIYTITAANSVLLRIASGDNQRYEIHIMANHAANVAASAAILLPNNTTTAAGAITYEAISGQENTAVGVRNTNNSFLIDNSGTPYRTIVDVCCRTAGKYTISTSMGATNTLNITGIVSGRWTTDTTTVWASLGTLQWVNVWTGLIQVTRKL
jgi:hypothetical protein